VNIYAESSAVLAWLLGEAAGSRVREVLRHAELVMASDLVLIECDRVLIRAVTLGEIDEATAADRRAHLNAAAAHWHLCRLSLDIVDRARRPFPSEPVRTSGARQPRHAVENQVFVRSWARRSATRRLRDKTAKPLATLRGARSWLRNRSWLSIPSGCPLVVLLT
jgi:hypothetical protein